MRKEYAVFARKVEYLNSTRKRESMEAMQFQIAFFNTVTQQIYSQDLSATSIPVDAEGLRNIKRNQAQIQLRSREHYEKNETPFFTRSHRQFYHLPLN